MAKSFTHIPVKFDNVLCHRWIFALLQCIHTIKSSICSTSWTMERCLKWSEQNSPTDSTKDIIVMEINEVEKQLRLSDWSCVTQKFYLKQ